MSSEKIIHSAYWTSRDSGVVTLNRDWLRGVPPPIFWGRERKRLKSLRPAPLVEFGNHSGYYMDDSRLHFVLRSDRLPRGFDATTGLFVAGPFNDWKPDPGAGHWRMQPRRIGSHDYLSLELPRGQIVKSRPVPFKFVTGAGEWLPVFHDAPNVVVDAEGNRNYCVHPRRSGRHQFVFRTPEAFSETRERLLVFDDGTAREEHFIHAGVFIKSMRSDRPLGACIENGDTVFRIFAPRAERVELLLFEKLDAMPQEGKALERISDTVWELAVPGVREGWFYFFRIQGDEEEGLVHFDSHFLIVDPYARACVGPTGPAIVVDPARIRRPSTPFNPPAWHDLVIMEAHLRDLTAYAPVELTDQERLGFAGLRKWVESDDFYPAALGVNAIELQPVQEFDTVQREEYGWGYMPVNYFAPASQYAADPARASQVQEFADLIDAFHKRGMAVIMDVVYNHVGVPNFLQFIDKEYYFLLGDDGEYLNFSGCGNTLDANTPMVRRLIIDSLVYFLETFDVDGFRFDLGELIGAETLAIVEKAIKKVKPSVFIVAEPWSFRGHIAKELRETGIASWNDGYREFMRDYVLGHGNPDGLRYFMQGSPREWSRFPAQSLNYVESHDDRCWIDKITENPHHNGYFPTPNDRRRTHLMIATLMLSAGIPMVSAGMDMLKSKHGQNNTYLRGDLNAIPYSRARFYSGTHEYFRRWIAFRRSTLGRLVRLDGAPPEDYWHCTWQGGAFATIINDNQLLGPQRLLFAINPHFEDVALEIPDRSLGGFVQIADHERPPAERILTARIPIHDASVIELPPLSCALWVADG